MPDTPERPKDGVAAFLTIAGGQGEAALAFHERAFGGEVIERNLAGDGKRLIQASARLTCGWIMLSDEFPERGLSTPPAAAAAATLRLQVDDVDAW